MNIRKALPMDENRIVAIDKAVIGSDIRRNEISKSIEDGLCIVSENDLCITGFAIMSYHFFGNGFVELLIIHPDYQRSGFGSALLQQCIAICRTNKLFTSTNKSNLPMQALLQKEHFIFCGEIDHLDEGDPELIYLAPAALFSSTQRA